MTPRRGPADRDVLQGHAAAHPGRRRAGARPAGAAAGRAVQRHGPAAAHAHDEPAAHLGDRGHTILFSSHILEEVEQVSGTVQVIVAGRLAASGDYRKIRRLMTNRPHVFALQSSDDRRLAVALIAREVGQRRGDRRHRADGPRRATTAASPAPCRGSPSGEGIRLRKLLPVRRIPGERLLLPAGGLTCRPLRGSPPAACSAGAGCSCSCRCRCCSSAWRCCAAPTTSTRPSGEPRSWSASGLAVVLPVISLIVGTGVLGSEVDDGTIVHILTKPLPRRDIILAKLGRGGHGEPR